MAYIAYQLSTLRRRVFCKGTSSVVMQHGHVRVDKVLSHRAVIDESPAVVIVHVDACFRINH